jgi:hypothetical protein
MTKLGRIAALLLCLFIASALLARIWLNYPDLFPEIPRPIAERLVHLYGAQNAEEIADLEILIGLGLSMVFISMLGLIAWMIWRRLHHHKAR